jgi:hypothetical protein
VIFADRSESKPLTTGNSHNNNTPMEGVNYGGSAQESDEGCILGGFPENDDFSPSSRPNTRFRRKWAEFAALLWKWRAEGGREE